MALFLDTNFQNSPVSESAIARAPWNTPNSVAQHEQSSGSILSSPYSCTLTPASSMSSSSSRMSDFANASKSPGSYMVRDHMGDLVEEVFLSTGVRLQKPSLRAFRQIKIAHAFGDGPARKFSRKKNRVRKARK